MDNARIVAKGLAPGDSSGRNSVTRESSEVACDRRPIYDLTRQPPDGSATRIEPAGRSAPALPTDDGDADRQPAIMSEGFEAGSVLVRAGHSVLRRRLL